MILLRYFSKLLFRCSVPVSQNKYPKHNDRDKQRKRRLTVAGLTSWSVLCQHVQIARGLQVHQEDLQQTLTSQVRVCLEGLGFLRLISPELLSN